MACALVGAALVVCLGLREVMGPTPVSVFILPIIIAAWHGGRASGLLATALASAAAASLLVLSSSAAEPNLIDGVRVGIVSVTGIVISVLTGAVAESRSSASHLATKEQRRLVEVMVERERLAAIITQMPAAVAFAERSGRVVLENPRVKELLGHSLSDVTSFASYGQLHGRNDETGEPLTPEEYPLPRALRGEIIVSQEYRYLRSDGREVWLRAAAAPVKDARGDISGAMVIFRNIDPEKEVALRLADSERALIEASRLKDQFLATLSHELRNPLAAIMSAVQVLEVAGDNAQTRERAQAVIERQGQQLNRLVNDLLEVSRISQGKITLEQEVVDLNEIAAAAADTVRAQIERREQRFDLFQSSDPVTVQGDPGRLTQVIVNLLTNASKYTDVRGRVILSTSIAGGSAMVRVADNGIGIPSDMLKQIFNPMTQVEAHRARSEGGLGLGLALAQSLVQLHGGSITAHSDGDGRGSHFTFYLPLHQPRRLAAAQRSTSQLAS